MNKTQLVAAVAAKADCPRTVAASAVDALFDVIADELAEGERVAIPAIGVFQPSYRAAREARNPRTGAIMEVGAHTVVRFRPSPVFSARIERPAPRRGTR